jgi:hypothetical protein
MGFTLPSGRIEDLDTPDAHVTFIRSQWRDFAAFAWGKYVSEGRGAVVVDLSKASKIGESLQVPTFYVAESSERLSNRGGWPSEEIAEVVRDYDPEQDVVFIFIRLDGCAFHYNASDDLTPPQAYQTKRKANESRDCRLSFDEHLTSN